MKYRRYEPEVDDNTVRKLHKSGQTPEEIAKQENWNPSTIRVAVRRLHLSRSPGRPSNDTPEAELPPGGDTNRPLALARHAFGSRLTESKGSYCLDGTPIKFVPHLMRRTNEERVRKGLPQFGAVGVAHMKRWYRYRGSYLTRVQFARIVEKRRRERGK